MARSKKKNGKKQRPTKSARSRSRRRSKQQKVTDARFVILADALYDGGFVLVDDGGRHMKLYPALGYSKGTILWTDGLIPIPEDLDQKSITDTHHLIVGHAVRGDASVAQIVAYFSKIALHSKSKDQD